MKGTAVETVEILKQYQFQLQIKYREEEKEKGILKLIRQIGFLLLGIKKSVIIGCSLGLRNIEPQEESTQGPEKTTRKRIKKKTYQVFARGRLGSRIL